MAALEILGHSPFTVPLVGQRLMLARPLSLFSVFLVTWCFSCFSYVLLLSVCPGKNIQRPDKHLFLKFLPCMNPVF